MTQVNDVLAPGRVAILHYAMKYNETPTRSQTMPGPSDIEEFLVSRGGRAADSEKALHP